MEIFAVRHPKIDKELLLASADTSILDPHALENPGVCYGQADVDLDPNWKSEVEALVPDIQGKDFEGFFSSPLSRCMKAAKYLYGLVHEFATVATPKADARLMELNFGNWELKTWDSLPKKEMDYWMEDFIQNRCPRGEAYFDLLKRVSRFLKDLGRNYLVPLQSEESKVLIVTHAGVIRCLFHFLEGVGRKEVFSIKLDYGKLYRFSFDPSKTKLI
jgi:alpha-ribazole phosphatase